MYISKEERQKLKEAICINGTLTEDDKIDNDITVEVDGEVITDTNDTLEDTVITDVNDEGISSENDQKDALDGYGSKLAITDMLLSAVNDENEAIQFYNSLIAACIEEGYQDIANIVKHISEEENIHVGMLQHAMATISEQAKTIKDGEEEAAQITTNGNEKEFEAENAAIEA